MKRGRSLAAISSLATVLFWCGTALSGDTLESAIGLIAEKRYPEARRVLDPLLVREPDHPRLRLVHGILRLREGFPGEAIDILEELQLDHPEVFEAANNLAVIYGMQGRLDDARETLLATLKRRPEALLYENLGDVYTKLAQRAYADARALKAGQGIAPAASAGSTDRADERAEPPAGPSGVRRAETASRPPSSADGNTAGVRPAGAECARAVGFENRATAQEAADWLRSLGTEVVGPYLEERQEIKRYRVYVPPLASRKEAAAMVRKIREQGIGDVALINRGALANAISLGVYRREPNMRRRVAQLERMGIPVQSVAETTSVKTEAWAIEARAVRDRDALDTAWTSRFSGRPLRSVACGR